MIASPAARPRSFLPEYLHFVRPDNGLSINIDGWGKSYGGTALQTAKRHQVEKVNYGEFAFIRSVL